MNAILFLVRRELKNSLLDLLRHPARLAGYILVLALLAFSILQKAGNPAAGDDAPLQDFRILEGVYFGLLLLIGLPVFLSGLKQGTTFFNMGDVNFLFCSPVSPKTIMAYGIVRRAASSLLLMVFLLFYGVMAVETFGVTWEQILLLLGGVAASLVIFQILALTAFNFCSGRPGRTRGVKILLGTVLAMVVLSLLSAFLGGGGRKDSILAAVASPGLEMVPLFGWIKGTVFGIIAGDPFLPWLYLGLTFLCTGGALGLFLKSNSDYYEDVLQTTQTAFEARQAMKAGDGRRQADTGAGRKIRVIFSRSPHRLT